MEEAQERDTSMFWISRNGSETPNIRDFVLDVESIPNLRNCKRRILSGLNPYLVVDAVPVTVVGN